MIVETEKGKGKMYLFECINIVAQNENVDSKNI